MEGFVRAVAVLVVAVVTGVAVGVSGVAAQVSGFEDVPTDAFFAVPVADLAALGVFVGTGCDEGFCPEEAIDRKTMAVWVVRILDGRDPPHVVESRFDDVDAGGLHAAFIERMAELGVTSGCRDGSGFCPDRSVTRAEMAAFISRAYGLADGPDPLFSDVPGDAWYAADVARLAAAEITAGCGDGTRFCPDPDTTRGEMAAFLWRAERPPGLAIGAPTVSDHTPMVGQSLALGVTVRNRGGASGSATLVYYRSSDPAVTPDDTEVGTDRVSGLDPAAASAESVLVFAPSAPGTYYYGGCVESASGEGDTANDCSEAVAVDVSAFSTEDLVWVADGLTDSERRLLDLIRALARVDSSIAHRIAGSLWIHDGVTGDEEQVVADLVALARRHPELAARVGTVPPDSTGNLVEAVVRSLDTMLSRLPGLPGRLLGQSWFRDGLTEQEAALVVVLFQVAGVEGLEDVFEDLLDGGHVGSETITVPLAGEVDLFVVSRSQSGLDDMLETLAYGVETQEAFLETPWPNPDVITLLELESDLNQRSIGWYAGTHIVLKQTRVGLARHELGHYYFHGGNSPGWLAEGAAEFLAAYTREQSGREDLVFGHSNAQVFIRESCAPHGAGDIQGWIDATARQAELPDCYYALGELFLVEMYRHVGQRMVSSSLRDLYETHLTTGTPATEDDIYQAFLENTPRSQRETFRACYHRRHGRPIPGFTAPPPEAPSIEIRDALAALYHTTNGPGWTNNDNWLTTAPLDQWHGVYTGCDGSLIGLSFNNNQLSGPIPPELGNLTNLEWLDLYNNQLLGPIPPELGNLTNLTILWLRNNQLSGPIPPELGNLTNLAWLDLVVNQLSGPIPPELASLTNLTRLYLYNNRLSGPIPPELGNLTNLTQLWLSNNQLSGPIPPELADLTNLAWLDLQGNQLSGPIPPELGDLTNLEWLWLHNNQLSGPVPPELSDLSNLTELSLYTNQLSGPIPPELGDLTNLTELSLHTNQLSGPIPPELGNLTNLTTLYLNGNRLSGPIPPELANLTNLTQLSLRDNQLSGPIPPELGNLTNLTQLRLHNNQLSGPIPPELGNLTNLTSLWLGLNQLTGCVPRALANVEDNDLDDLGLRVCEDS